MKKWLSNFLVKYLIKKSKVIANKKIGDRFQLLTIMLSDKKEWIPGQKVQIKISDQELRSYTPINWKSDQRTFETLIYNHGNGPGAKWSVNAKAFMPVQVLGPRNSLDVRNIKDDIFFFGDETTFGLAFALKESRCTHNINFFFEATHATDSSNALHYLGLEPFKLFERMAHDQHLNDCFTEMITAYKNQTIILSGKKDSLEFLNTAFLQKGIPAEKLIKKRYWGWKKTESIV